MLDTCIQTHTHRERDANLFSIVDRLSISVTVVQCMALG